MNEMVSNRKSLTVMPENTTASTVYGAKVSPVIVLTLHICAQGYKTENGNQSQISSI
jgi:hypothetical protein